MTTNTNYIQQVGKSYSYPPSTILLGDTIINFTHNQSDIFCKSINYMLENHISGDALLEYLRGNNVKFSVSADEDSLKSYNEEGINIPFITQSQSTYGNTTVSSDENYNKCCATKQFDLCLEKLIKLVNTKVDVYSSTKMGASTKYSFNLNGTLLYLGENQFHVYEQYLSECKFKFDDVLSVEGRVITLK